MTSSSVMTSLSEILNIFTPCTKTISKDLGSIKALSWKLWPGSELTIIQIFSLNVGLASFLPRGLGQHTNLFIHQPSIDVGRLNFRTHGRGLPAGKFFRQKGSGACQHPNVEVIWLTCGSSNLLRLSSYVRDAHKYILAPSINVRIADNLETSCCHFCQMNQMLPFSLISINKVGLTWNFQEIFFDISRTYLVGQEICASHIFAVIRTQG